MRSRHENRRSNSANSKLSKLRNPKPQISLSVAARDKISNLSGEISMSSQAGSEDGEKVEEAAAEEEVLRLEEEVEELAQKIHDYRTTLPGQLSSTISSLLESQRPVLPTHLLDEADPHTRKLPTDAGSMRDTTNFPVMEDSDEAEKIQLLKQKISSNASAMPVVLNRMKEYMARIDKLESSNGIIHPAFKRKRTT